MRPLYRLLAIILFVMLANQNAFAYHQPYHSHFYKGYIVKQNGDTLYGQILLEPDSYYDSSGRFIKRPFKKFRDFVIVRKKDATTNHFTYLFLNRRQVAFARLYYTVLITNFGGTIASFNYSKFTQWISNIEKRNIVQYFTDFESFVFGQDTLLLRLLNSDKIEVYDDFLNPEKNISSSPYDYDFLTPVYSSLFGRQKIYIAQAGKIEEVPNHFELNFNFERTIYVLRFLNRRYGTSFGRHYFKSDREMFAYIAAHG